MKNIVILLSLLMGIEAFAQEEANSCNKEIKEFCSQDKKDLKRTLGCLKKNHEKLSVKCRQFIERNVKESIQTKPPTGMLFSGMGGLGGSLGFIPLIRYQSEVSGKIKSDDKNSKTRIIRQSIEGSTPLAKVGKGLLSSSLRYGQTRFDQDLVLNSGVKVDEKLEQFEIGLNYNRRLENKRNFNIRANYGYRGDRIGGSDYNYSLMTGYSHPTSSGKSRWQYFLMFSNNGPLGNNIPIPGVMYFYRTQTMNILFGLPVFSLQWNPDNSLFGVSISSFGPFYNIEMNYGLTDEIQYFIFSRWKQENFILSDRDEDEDRLNIYEKISGIGIRSVILNNNLGLEIRAGYSQDRKLYLGDGLFNNDKGSRDLNDSTFIKLMISKAFR